MHVVATAGHVDHGKSTLVLHLTGTDPDRLPEEKARGLTIDLGFADAELPSGRTVAFVDVPGHVRFVRNMLAGVGSVEACLFVVSAVEGWKPQSEEHLRILDLLGVSRGVVALTRATQVSSDQLEWVRLEVEDAVSGTFLAGATAVATDAIAGLGIDELRSALDDVLAPEAAGAARIGTLDRPRLWIDRAFSITGSGTVVTGTLTGGVVSVDDDVVLEPAGSAARVRAMQSLHRPVTSAGSGSRVALNLTGLHALPKRGDVVVRDGQWHRCRVFDASLTVLPHATAPVSRRGAHLAHFGSAEVAVRVRVLGPTAIEPGETGAVRVHLPLALPLVPGDRFILRDSGRATTVGGGEVLDVDPIVPAARAAPSRSVERVVAERGWVDVDVLERLTGQRVEPDAGRWAIAPDQLARAVESIRSRCAAAGAVGLDLATLDVRERVLLDRVEGVVVRAGRLYDEEHLEDEVHPWVAELAEQLFTPPPVPDDLDRSAVRELVRRGLVVELGGVSFHASVVEAAGRELRAMLDDRPEGVTVSMVRERLGTTRRFLIPLLEHLDATGRTRRRGDLRVAGPRL